MKANILALLVILGILAVTFALSKVPSVRENVSGPATYTSDTAGDPYQADREAAAAAVQTEWVEQAQSDLVDRMASPSCVDVTSYDYNWDNDMLCTNPDGSQYYTSYEGARGY